MKVHESISFERSLILVDSLKRRNIQRTRCHLSCLFLVEESIICGSETLGLNTTHDQKSSNNIFRWMWFKFRSISQSKEAKGTVITTKLSANEINYISSNTCWSIKIVRILNTERSWKLQKWYSDRVSRYINTSCSFRFSWYAIQYQKLFLLSLYSQDL